MCYYFFVIKATIIYQSHSNDGIVFNCIFRYSLDYIKYFMSSILNTAQYFRRVLNKGVYGILFILAQNAYMYTPVFSYALYVPVFFCITPAYKNFYFPYSAMFYAVFSFKVKHLNLFYIKFLEGYWHIKFTGLLLYNRKANFYATNFRSRLDIFQKILLTMKLQS